MGAATDSSANTWNNLNARVPARVPEAWGDNSIRPADKATEISKGERSPLLAIPTRSVPIILVCWTTFAAKWLRWAPYHFLFITRTTQSRQVKYMWSSAKAKNILEAAVVFWAHSDWHCFVTENWNTHCSAEELLSSSTENILYFMLYTPEIDSSMEVASLFFGRFTSPLQFTVLKLRKSWRLLNLRKATNCSLLLARLAMRRERCMKCDQVRGGVEAVWTWSEDNVYTGRRWIIGEGIAALMCVRKGIEYLKSKKGESDQPLPWV